MKICFFAPAYPGRHDASHFAFVKQLVDAIAKLGHECHVIAPYNVLHYRKLSPRYECYKINGINVHIYRPYYLSFSGLSKLSLFKWLAERTRRSAIRKAISKLPTEIDIVYGHFWVSGYRGYQFALSHNLPLFVASGESEIQKLFEIPKDVAEFKEYVSGVVCVSSKNKLESIQLGLTTEEKCGVFPNAVNTDLFYKRDRETCRKILGFPINVFIIIYVGWFDERKGARRVSEAINSVGNVYSIFIGKGKMEPECDGILFKGTLPHNQIPLYLSAADCFILPTRAEGCCNAIIEAMACGLPVISSNLSFNWDVLDNHNSILVDPNNIAELANAISALRENSSLRLSLSEGALNTAEQLSINKRAESIMNFINSKKK